MKKTTKCLGAAILVGVMAATTAVAMADGDNQSTSVGSSSFVRAASEWHSDSTEPATARDRSLLAQLAAGVDEAGLKSASDGRSIRFGADRRIGVIPGESNSLCQNVEVDGSSIYRGCGQGFADDGTAIAYTIGGGDPTTLIGLVASDVESIDIETTDGEQHALDIVDGAVWWSASSNTHVRSMTTVRDGVSHVETDRFVEPKVG
jgi:hypothetical protein